MLSQFTTNDRHQKNKKFLGEIHDFPEGSMAVGRLDELSEGLLLITTDGLLSHYTNNSGQVDKEYVAQVDGLVTATALSQLENGVAISINGALYNTKPCIVESLEEKPELPVTLQKIRDERHGPTSWISITLNEGKFRQVRKMTSVVGYPTLRLARTRIADFTIADLNGATVVEIEDKRLRDLLLNND